MKSNILSMPLMFCTWAEKVCRFQDDEGCGCKGNCPESVFARTPLEETIPAVDE